ncbi:MAG: replication-associated recombination protein A [Clostridia bacterium]|nr:replication-associated recombination protein A [Clostridia bacterium]
MKPLADYIRPQSLDDVVGQKHIIGDNKPLSNIISSGEVPNMIFYGPSGTGKTTIANICASLTSKKLFKLNATTASLKDIREVAASIDDIEGRTTGVLLYLDEIQNFNKKQQQSLLEYIENGSITLIASTTENPYFYIYNAILSRCTVVEFKPVEADDIVPALKRALKIAHELYPGRKIFADDNVLLQIANSAYGDVRKAITILEMCIKSSMSLDSDVTIYADTVIAITQKSSFAFDKDGDNHYDVLSAFQKSIRGSDPDAAIHYLARLVEGGDLISICRRLLVISAEDIGLAYPNAIAVTKACVDSAMQLGFPEARIPLAEAVIFLAGLPKSNSAICAIDEALADVRSGNAGEIPPHIRDGHYSGAEKLGRAQGYKYPHSYPNSYVKQQYLPDNLIDRKYYNPGINKMEDSIRAYLDKIKS